MPTYVTEEGYLYV